VKILVLEQRSCFLKHIFKDFVSLVLCKIQRDLLITKDQQQNSLYNNIIKVTYGVDLRISHCAGCNIFAAISNNVRECSSPRVGVSRRVNFNHDTHATIQRVLCQFFDLFLRISRGHRPSALFRKFRSRL